MEHHLEAGSSVNASEVAMYFYIDKLTVQLMHTVTVCCASALDTGNILPTSIPQVHFTCGNFVSPGQECVVLLKGLWTKAIRIKREESAVQVTLASHCDAKASSPRHPAY
jgi:hypothetical protein